ncbi:uncharacterized protein LOC111244728 isoform X1 [Varroa destructor]|uniref:Uncharacterized protein n=1 Tax=Varroa destructor TaxID=109461 RepID=A0A7M7J8M4_VARDE|nr:uncharacterized protein LOC111244728 isoform X1 [Varroa destructor]XP_022647821.1 uncharacterized protein LOC111244728 isoform X1 [Varroa destructor]XP_022647823.1 uncharacterized protein LOC111244728 isoform X1 [Varroa destructor]
MTRMDQFGWSDIRYRMLYIMRYHRLMIKDPQLAKKEALEEEGKSKRLERVKLRYQRHKWRQRPCRRIMLEYTRNQMLFEVKLTKRENRKKLNLHYEILITNMLSIENGQQSKAVIVNLALSTIKNAYWIQMGH